MGEQTKILNTTVLDSLRFTFGTYFSTQHKQASFPFSSSTLTAEFLHQYLFTGFPNSLIMDPSDEFSGNIFSRMFSSFRSWKLFPCKSHENVGIYTISCTSDALKCQGSINVSETVGARTSRHPVTNLSNTQRP